MITSFKTLKDKYTHNTCQIYVKPHSKNTQITLESQIFDEKALRLRSCLFCEGRISVLKRWFKTPIQNAVNSGYCSSSSEPERRLYDVI